MYEEQECVSPVLGAGKSIIRALALVSVEGFFAAPHLVGEMEGLVSSLRVTPIAMGSTSLGLND